MSNTTSRLGQALVALAIMAVVLQPVAAAAGGLVFSDDAKAPNPEIETGVQKDTHDMAAHDSLLEYDDDSGEKAVLPANLNQSADNPVTYEATSLDADAFGRFPTNDVTSQEDISALDAANWTAAGPNSSKLTISDMKHAPGVEGVQMEATLDSGDSANAKFVDFAITTDAEKRFAQFVVDVRTLNGTSTIEIYDADGDLKRLEINANKNVSKRVSRVSTHSPASFGVVATIWMSFVTDIVHDNTNVVLHNCSPDGSLGQISPQYPDFG